MPIQRPNNVIEEVDGGILLHIRVQPKASRNDIRRDAEGRIRVAVTAPPEAGAANKAVQSYVARLMGTPKRNVIIVSGEKSKNKVLKLITASIEQIKAKIDCIEKK